MTASTEKPLVSREELLARATALVPLIKQRAARTEQLRQLPPETFDDLVASQLMRIGNPVPYGGLGVDLDMMFEVAVQLGRGCGSTAWCYALWTIHNWWMGHFSREAADEYFATGPDTFSSTGVNPFEGKATPVDGGYRLSGRWGFSSGCDGAIWVTMGAQTPDGPLWFMVPRAGYTVEDTWFVMGMRGTGSKHIIIKDAFVPHHRVMDPEAAGLENMHGWNVYGRTSYRAPMRMLTAWDLCAPIIGMAQGAVDEVTARLYGTSGPGRTADSVAMQLRLADAAVHAQAAYMMQQQTVAGILERAARGHQWTPLDRAEAQRNKSFVARLCVRAVDILYEASGAHAVFDGDVLQRIHRDIHTGSHHAGIAWDTWGAQWGKLALGGPQEFSR